MRPRVEKVGSVWWVNWTETYHGQVVQKARPHTRWADAMGWANSLAEAAA